MLRGAVAALGGLLLVRPAAAHGGSLHASTPHWVLVGTALFGVLVVAGSVELGRTRWTGRPRRTVRGVLLGAVIATVGTVGVTQVQLDPGGGPSVTQGWFPALTALAALLVLLGSLVGVWVRWPHRPRYAALGTLLGVWIEYPVLMPRGGTRHPLGYVLVLAVPVTVGYVLRRDVAPVVSTAVTDRFARRVGVAVAVLLAVFFVFSAGLLTVNPDAGVNVPSQPFVVVTSFADPLVLWPAVEFAVPSVPLFGALSVGTALVVGLLATLAGLNTAMTTALYERDASATATGGVAGVVATGGATACCCCGPAVYAMASALVGVSATPLYWAFVDPASPLGALFFAAAILLLTGSSIRLARQLDAAGVCDHPGGASS